MDQSTRIGSIVWNGKYNQLIFYLQSWWGITILSWPCILPSCFIIKIQDIHWLMVTAQNTVVSYTFVLTLKGSLYSKYFLTLSKLTLSNQPA